MTKRRTLTPAEMDELVVRESDDDSAWGPPIHIAAKPWARRVAVRRLDLAARFHVLSVLYGLGADAAVSVGTQKDVDITVVRRPGEVVTVDVKVAQDSTAWRIDDFPVDQSHFIVFVSFPRNYTVDHFVPKSYVLNSRVLHAWAKDHDGVVDAKKLLRASTDAREAWDRLLSAA